MKRSRRIISIAAVISAAATAAAGCKSHGKQNRQGHFGESAFHINTVTKKKTNGKGSKEKTEASGEYLNNDHVRIVIVNGAYVCAQF
ncbi:MAG: hypothetical protein VZR11_08360 [Succinimonas sp.]|nr:hypothetical protein [Succinimonas sp.]